MKIHIDTPWGIRIIALLVIFLFIGVSSADITKSGNVVTFTENATHGHSKATKYTYEDLHNAAVAGGWGANVPKLSESLYRTINISFMLGNSSHDAYFGDEKKTIEVYRMPDMAFYFDSPVGKGHLFLGEVSSVAGKTGKNGCLIRFESPDMLMDQGGRY